MNELQKVPASELSPADSRTWIVRIVIGVLIGEAMWGFLVSVTTDLVLPAMARFMGGDAQSPLYLGQGDFKAAALFTSLLELCFAGIVAVLLNSWSRSARRVRSKSLRPVPLAPRGESPTSSVPNTAMQANSTGTVQTPQSPPQVAQTAKEKPPKKVYYNIAGDPVDVDDE